MQLHVYKERGRMVLKLIQLLVALSLLVACRSNQQHTAKPAPLNDSTGSRREPLTSAHPATAAITATPSPQLVRLVIFDEPE